MDYRIVAACRNGTLCTIKRGWTEAKVIALLESQVSLIPQCGNLRFFLPFKIFFVPIYAGKKVYKTDNFVGSEKF